MKTFVVSDIHGDLALLHKCIAAIESFADTGTVIFTGDYVDRGPDSAGVVEYLMQGPENNGFRWSFIRGNHEDMILACHDGMDFEWWLRNGGDATLKSYDGSVTPAHLLWISLLPRLTWDRHRVYVHAGLDSTIPLTEQSQEDTQWKRYRKTDHDPYPGKHIVHGHTPIKDGPELLEWRTNLDTGGVFTGRMVVGVFDDAIPGGPVTTIEVTR